MFGIGRVSEQLHTRTVGDLERLVLQVQFAHLRMVHHLCAATVVTDIVCRPTLLEFPARRRQFADQVAERTMTGRAWFDAHMT